MLCKAASAGCCCLHRARLLLPASQQAVAYMIHVRSPCPCRLNPGSQTVLRFCIGKKALAMALACLLRSGRAYLARVSKPGERLAHTYPVWCRGAWRSPVDASPGIHDSGFLRGFGIFDFLRIVNGRPVFLADREGEGSYTS